MKMSAARYFAVRLWASPCTSLGLLVGLLGLMTGGRGRIRQGVFEFWGGAVALWLRAQFMLASGASAMALGHVVLARDLDLLELCRDHELVHVRQYEVWGPFFLPAYFTSSIMAHLRGGNFYHDNIFEKEAYGYSDPGSKAFGE